jgi:hypothetical protein
MSITKQENDQHSNHFTSAIAARCGQSSQDPYDWSNNDEEYLMPKCVVKTTPRRSDCASCLITSARLYLNSTPESPKTWGQVYADVNESHSDPMEIHSLFWLPDISSWWHQQEETHSK